MIPFEEMSKAVASGLREYIGIPVILANQTAEAPAHPYATYNVTTPAQANGGTYQQHEDGIDRKQVRSVWSITILAKEWGESLSLATKAREWFEHTGRMWLAEHGITVQSTTDVNNRDNILTVEYERKNGFDVFFYVFDEVGSPAKTYGYIEGAEIAREILK